MYLVKTGLCLFAFVISGCEARNLYIAHDTVVGINAQISQDRQKGRLVLGYDRDFVTIIPKSVDTKKDGREEVMSSLGCNYIVVDGIALVEYRDMIVTGDAAIELAKKLNGQGELFNCEQNGEEP